MNAINRLDFGVGWQGILDRGGIIAGNELDIAIDIEAVVDAKPFENS
jgi:polyisoprenoid-binding protein YceI